MKGKPKYVTVYKSPKPTAQPASKPTTVYHMPIYSPTYEYMSMDPMNSIYGASMMYNPYQQVPSSYKSAMSTDAEGGTSSVATASHGGVDYDDDASSYYVRKAAARRRKLMPGDYASASDVHRHDDRDGHQMEAESSNHDQVREAFANHEAQHQLHQQQQYQTGANGHDGDMLQSAASSINEDENYDHEDDAEPWLHTHDPRRLRRSKRQVYYESGYDGEANCEGFPLEVNIRSRVKLDRLFPIYGKSQIKKCVKK